MMRCNAYSVVIVTLLLITQTRFSVGECQPDDGAVELKPKFIKPTIDPLELLPSQSVSLVCEVQREIDPEDPPTQSLRIWWCNSTYPECWQEQQSFNMRHNIFLSKTQSQANNASYLSSVFNLTNVASGQADRYYCVAFSQDQRSSNCPGSVSVDVRIRDKAEPSITDHTLSVDVLVGDPFNLTCRANGYPTPKFHWRKDNLIISGGETGTFMKRSADMNDAGTYRCTAKNDYGTSGSSDIHVMVDMKQQNGMSTAVVVVLIVIAVGLAVLLVIIIVALSRMRSNMTCFTIHKTNVQGNNNKTIHAKTVNVYTDTGGRRLSRGDSSHSHERRTFLHMHDVFIHNHSSDNQLAGMIRSKLQDRESHLKVGLWSEVERPDRSSSRNKLLRLQLVNCTRIVIIVSENYLKYDYHALTSALAKSRAKPESIKGKVIIVRVVEETQIPKDLTKDIMTSLEYNVETDSCYFWPKFLKVAMPDQKDILYWV